MIRLLIADDHPIVREGLKRMIVECVDMRVVGEAADSHELLVLARRVQADVLLLDISMPGAGFLTTLRHVKAIRPDLRVLVLSVHPEDQYAVRALKDGAAGYLTKDHSPEALAKAIRRVHGGRTYVTASLAERLASQLVGETERPGHEALSEREFEVLCLLGSGQSVNDIARKLALSPKTISTYRARILEKMELKTNAELIRYTLEHGLDD